MRRRRKSVEHALAPPTADDCVVIVADRTTVNLRWADNTLHDQRR